MILDRITLHDFGVYAGVQEIDLTPPSPGKSIVLFGGLNGTGKTTLMDALQLCLFGPAAKCAGRRNGDDYRDFLARNIHKRSRWEQASIEVIFRCVMDGIETRYRVIRSWQRAGASIKEKLEVTRNKQLDKALTENWSQYVNEIIPVNIAHLFFFDGEKIEVYASPEGAQELVAIGIRNLFGLDLVDRLQKDLRIIERRKQSVTMPNIDKEVIRQKEKSLASIKEQIDRMVEKRATLQTRELDVAKRDLERVIEEYRVRGGELRERREEIESRVGKAEANIRICHMRMIELASGQLPFVLINDLLSDVAKQASKEKKIVNARAMIKNLRQRDTEMISLIQNLPNTDPVVEALREFSRVDIEKQEKLAKCKILIDVGENEMAHLDRFLQSEMPSLKKIVKDLLKEQCKLEDEMETALLEKAGIPSEESVNEIVKRRDDLIAKISQLGNDILNIDNETEKMRQEKERLESEIDTLWEENAKVELSRKDIVRFTRHSQLARQTLTEFESAILRRQIGRVENLALESFQSLLHKDRLISELNIGLEDFGIVLRDMERAPIFPEQLSAGERQLLAVSLLWGMAKASGKSLPVAIDTPMGRLDSIHREHLIDRYFPFASHQTLLFTTDEEISGEYLQRLSPWIGNSYRLDYNDSTGATSVSKGFLENV